jgi:predicted DNA-binding transcriptional regulator
MQTARMRIDKHAEKAINDILKSKAEARIYIYLLRKNGAISENIIKGTKLHPSTVRELLSKMYDQKLIFREKLKNDCIGKNPYLYKAVSPIKLLQKYTKEMEGRLSRLANLAVRNDQQSRFVKIKSYERLKKT